MFKTVFKRYEFKYMLTKQQKIKILEAMKEHMVPDEFGKTTIRNLYFDTDNYRLIRRSIEGPAYKEKLRIRSYCKADEDSTVFVELKKKYHSVVYKRRLSLKENDAMSWVCNRTECPVNSQITDEIDYFIDYYGNLKPTVYLSYDREAYFAKNGDDFRITFDENIMFRQSDLSLKSDTYGTPIIDDDKVLMEIKCSQGIPMWMVNLLSKEHIYKTSFSKYGTAYSTIIYPKKKEKHYA